jgi:hypothetical protein
MCILVQLNQNLTAQYFKTGFVVFKLMFKIVFIYTIKAGFHGHLGHSIIKK